MSVQGDYVRHQRKRQGLSVSELARRVGVSHSNVSLIEKGTRTIGDDYLQRFATALDVSIFDLIVTTDAFNNNVSFDANREEKILYMRSLLKMFECPQAHSTNALTLIEFAGKISYHMQHGDMRTVEHKLIELAAFALAWSEHIAEPKGIENDR